MARIEDLIDEVADPALRDEIARQVKLIKSTKRFGLVFEDHVPETVSLHGLDISAGSVVQNRRKPDDPTRFRVLSVENGESTIVPVGLEEPEETVASEDLLVVKAFQEPIFPGLTPVGEVRRGPWEKPAHTVINGENFHALQFLAYTHAGRVDVIYIDPPYNTGARDWKYNNRFVDNNDAWRHSKWLAMMEKRLRLSKKLLSPDGVLVVTIDEHEVHHLGMLLEGMFPDALIQMITAVTNAGGVQQTGFSRIDEYAYFVLLGDAEIQPTTDDLYTEKTSKRVEAWATLLRRGTGAKPSDRPNQVYPIGIDPETKEILGVGRSLRTRVESGEIDPADMDSWRPDPAETVGGHPASWPIRSNGDLGRWMVTGDTLVSLAEGGFVRIGDYDPKRRTWAAYYISTGNRKKIASGEILVEGRESERGPVRVVGQIQRSKAKTVWNRPRHNAGSSGSHLLRRFLGAKRFDFPKSLYLVCDSIFTVLGDRPSGLVLDFFAGSGTTLHAVALLNAQDGGSRQCIMVTNNDVSEAEAKRLNKAGYFAGDPEFEAEGIFESVTRPRVEAVVTGIRPDGEKVEGKYLDQYLPDHGYADGFEENVAFFRMDYLEPDLVELGRQYEAIAPLLWMAAGSVGSWEEWDGAQPWSSPADSTYAVLFDLAETAAFASMVESRDEITHVWAVTDSHTAFVEVRQELPADVQVGQLYREYLRNFTVNASGVLD